MLMSSGSWPCLVRFLLTFALVAGSILAPSPGQAQPSGVARELYLNLPGSSLPDLTNSSKYPANPDAVFLESAFEAPHDFTDNYGQRMRALLVPPVTGSYTFYIASDDNSILFLSSDETPAHKIAIAYEAAWTSWRQWSKDAGQKSNPVGLVAGQRYYIEALQKEGTGGDNLSVTWQKPGDPAPADGAPPIPGTYLIAYGLGPPVIRVQPANVTVTEGGLATFSVTLAPTVGATYQWKRGGAPIANATNSYHIISPVSLSDNGAQFLCSITNMFGGTNSSTATLTVSADVTPPALVSASSLGDPRILTVIFSEPVEAATGLNAANYAISGGISVQSASFGVDTRTVILTTSPMSLGTNYLLTVNNVRDRAATPNRIATNSQVSFVIATAPLDVAMIRPSVEAPNASSRHGPIVISEIMYHPPPRTDGKNLEFIELYN